MNNRQIFRLNVEKIHQDCLFILSWGKGQQVKAVLAYPEILTKRYQVWQHAYTKYYQTAIRGRVEEQGSLKPIAPHTQLVQAEALLLTEFNHWLRNDKLFKIRSEIARVIKQFEQLDVEAVDLFLTGFSPELERLPWEAWEIEQEIATPVPIRIARTPANIRSEPMAARKRYRQGGARILAIFGDNTGLDFENDLKALRSLSSLAEIKIVSWQEGKSISHLKTEICGAITEQKGWDILFFAGHSRETEITGGELAIAPKTALAIGEIAPYLKKAQSRGLQFALFNSCSGLSIANSLIDLGLSQVAIMREPIHNNVAQTFLIQFLQALANYQDVLDALREACQFIKQERNIDYPSACLIPSLFCHPEAELFRIKPFGLKSRLQQWLPNRHQAIALSFLMLISLLPPVQDTLLNGRTLVQAIYRDLTQQIPSAPPPVLLVEIDEESLGQAKKDIKDFQRYPLDRRYLASLIDRLSALGAKAIGIDYLLDGSQGKNDATLAHSIQTAVEQKGIWFVFAAIQQGNREVGVLPDIADLDWSLQGSIDSYPIYVRPPQDCSQICPFGYLLAVAHTLQQNSVIHPKLNNKTDFRLQILSFLNQSLNDNQLEFLKQADLHSITQFSQYFGQRWLRPIDDFSLPFTTVYQVLPARQLRQPTPNTPKEEYQMQQQVVLIASGGYPEAGINGQPDYYPTPFGVAYWRNVYGIENKNVLTGGEAHAYTIHHWLRRHLIIPIPDLWIMGLAALLGKGTTLKLPHRRRLIKLGIVGTTTYGLVSVQSYIWAGLLLPWLLPTIVFWLYLLPTQRQSNYEK